MFVYIGVYEHKNWLKVINNNYSLTCDEKKDLARQTQKVIIPFDNNVKGGDHVRLNDYERNMYRPALYYLAVMDCDKDLIYQQETYGDGV